MKKEDIAVVAKLLTDVKDSLDELESSLKKNNTEKTIAAKRRILDLQMQINKKL